ncbi:CYTH and CHAD domain-containing protein [Microvirga puerhi]|uniref:CHAD domain-containing protein n=1 Tax=Microvirga puerhi TaxID=2876078 RepID=A0ABS7VLX3_9HYPH|nr:CHAD domain-containing protein [Microvirga puerhi]
MPREVELKLELASGTLDDLLAHSVLKKAKPLADQSGILRATYFDTPELALRQRQLSLRIREKDGHLIQTLKASGEESGPALDRKEWECPVKEGLDLDMLSDTPLADLLADAALRESLLPLFMIETRRRVFSLERDGALIELSLDQAAAIAGQQHLPFTEVELELKRGDTSALFSIALDLQDGMPLRLSTLTKSERGYRLLGADTATSVKAKEIAIQPHMSSEKAFQLAARACLFQVIQNEEILRRTRAPEALHQMRVGTRRLKAAVALFEPLVDDRESKAVRKRLRWIGRKLGHVRDMDVYVHTLRETGPDLDREALNEAERERAKAYEALLKTLEKRRFMRSVLWLAAWIEAGQWHFRRKQRVQEARAIPATDRASTELQRRWKRIRKGARRLPDLDAERRHKLRIRIKELRYGLEFFAATFPAKQAERRRQSMLSNLQDQQDELGEMNDIIMAEKLFPAHGAEKSQATRMKRLETRAEASARKLVKAKPFWNV